MNIKIVLAMFVSMMFLISCGAKDTDTSGDNTIPGDSEVIFEDLDDEYTTYSSIGGSGGTPENTDFEFNN